MNMRILVTIDQIERAGVEFYPARRTAQRNPQLLIQFLQRQQIRAIIDLHLIESARAKKIPGMREVMIFPYIVIKDEYGSLEQRDYKQIVNAPPHCK